MRVKYLRLVKDAASTYPPSTAKRSLRIPITVQNAFGWLKKQLPNLDPKDLLPLGIEVTTGAIVLGNPSTPSLLVAEFHTATGTFGVVAVSPQKPFRAVVAVLKSFFEVSIQVRPIQTSPQPEIPECLGATYG